MRLTVNVCSTSRAFFYLFYLVFEVREANVNTVTGIYHEWDFCAASETIVPHACFVSYMKVDFKDMT
jgi:hypothetical protein